MICGSGGSKSRLAKAAGAEPSGEMRDENLHAVAARSTCPSQNVQSTPCSDHFWKLRCRKSACLRGAKHISKSKVQKTDGYGAFLDVQMSFRVAGATDCAPCQKRAKREGFLVCPKTMVGVGQLKRIWKDAFSVPGAAKETCSSEMLFWEDEFVWQGQHFVWPWHHFFVARAILQRYGLEKSQDALARGRQLCRIASFSSLHLNRQIER